MKFSKLNKIHFVGIGGIGMCGIAKILHTLGYSVWGSDIKESKNTQSLREDGIEIFIGHSPNNIKDAELLVYSSVISPSNPEIIEAKRRGIPVISRGEMLAELTRTKTSIVVSGSHGKTTVTAMISHLASSSNLDPTVIIGGRLSTIGGTAKVGSSEILICEADESDRSFLLLYPSLAIITNIDYEHADTYKTVDEMKEAYLSFANKVPFYGKIIACSDDPNIREILPYFKRKVLTYGLLEGAYLKGERLSFSKDGEIFNVQLNGNDLGNFEIRQKGEHNVLNALASILASIEMDIPYDLIKSSLKSFPGVERRFQHIGTFNGIDFYDDYAHHPSELKALLECARIEGKGRRIILLFQPHRYTRLKAFQDQFARVLMEADLLFITEVYSAGETPIAGISGESLFKRIKELGFENVVYEKEIEALPFRVKDFLKTNDLVITAGAGNITNIGHKMIKLLKGEI